MSTFLDSVLLEIRKDRPKLPENYKYTIRKELSPDNNFLSLGFTTQGCQYNIRGGCTMCDYWISDPLTVNQIVSNVEEAIEKIDFHPDEILLNISGSFFDDYEVPGEARREIYKLLSRYEGTKIIFESHAKTISDKKILECLSYFDPSNVAIEMGLESANPWVLKYCINKHLLISDVEKAICRLKKYKIKSVVNILVGSPFLSECEMVKDSLYSVLWAFNTGVDKCVLFPMNVKPYTLVYWLEKKGLYSQPPLWALTDVLSNIPESLLPQVGIAWHRTRPQYHPLYNIENIGPGTCFRCYDQVMRFLDEFIENNEKSNQLQKINNIDCICKDEWKHKMAMEYPPLLSRIQYYYELVGKEILGTDRWDKFGDKVLQDIVESDGYRLINCF